MSYTRAAVVSGIILSSLGAEIAAGQCESQWSSLREPGRWRGMLPFDETRGRWVWVSEWASESEAESESALGRAARSTLRNRRLVPRGDSHQ